MPRNKCLNCGSITYVDDCPNCGEDEQDVVNSRSQEAGVVAKRKGYLD